MKLEQNSVKERLLEFIKFKRISQSKFENLTNLSNGYINNIRKSIKPSTFDEKIAPIFPELNKFWLLHGEGNMLYAESKESNTEQKKEAPFKELPIDSKLNLLYELIINQNKKVEQLILENENLKIQNEDIKQKLKDNLFVLQSEIEAIMDEFNMQLDEQLRKDINRIVQYQN